jgi:hypothetical protein
MTATPYKPVSWSEDELITPDKMSQITNNSQWLYENTPRVSYNAFKVNRATGIKIACGLMVMGSVKSLTHTKSVYFGNFFSAASHPIVTTGLTTTGLRKIFTTISGIGVLHPDQRGFQITCEGMSNLERSFYVTWQAMGF